MKKITFILFFALLFPSAEAFSQDMRKMLAYDFDGALAEYKDSLAAISDSLRRVPFEEAAKRAENGITMTEFCHHPTVVARKLVPADGFFLWYPMSDRSWHHTQDSSTFMYSPGAPSDTLVMARRDSAVYMPVVCGKEKYFASRELFGMGGYDLYVSRWDEKKQCWGDPENLGFPYSSPYDDFLFYNTEDGRYSVFASNRDCPPDMVNIYILEYDGTPVRSPESDPVKLAELARLDPSGTVAAKGPEKSKSGESEQVKQYREKLGALRSVREKIAAHNRALESLRLSYASSSPSSKGRIASDIMKRETEVDSLNLEMKKASSSLQALEMEFLQTGVTIDAAALAETPSETSARRYEFVKRTPGDKVYVKYNN